MTAHKINDFMFMHDPEAVLHDIQQACIQAADKWMYENRNDLSHAIRSYETNFDTAVIYNPDDKHPFIIYLKENNLGHVPGKGLTPNRYYVGFSDILPKKNKYLFTLYAGVRSEVCQMFQHKMIQYGIGTERT